MKISVISSVKNEAKNINQLLDSLSKQIIKPYEIVFVNDSSTDGTKNKILKYKKRLRRLKVIDVAYSNISKTRNEGIRNAKGDWIISIDGGCYIEEDYIKNLILCSKKNSKREFFGALTKIPYKNNFEHCYSILLERNASKNYLPKGHAFFFKKKLWENVKKFNENLRTAEDTEFISKAKKINQAPIICKKALVYWKPRKNLKELFIQFYKYGKGDEQAFGLKNLPIKSRINLLIAFIFPLSIFHASLISLKCLIKTGKVFSIFIGFFMDLIKIYAYSIGIISNMVYHN